MEQIRIQYRKPVLVLVLIVLNILLFLFLYGGAILAYNNTSKEVSGKNQIIFEDSNVLGGNISLMYEPSYRGSYMVFKYY